jgi:hypothetical protein
LTVVETVGDVSDFWSGAISSLVSAVVGGVFTATVAFVQVRAAYRTVSFQLERSYQDQVDLLRRQSTHRLAFEIADVLEREGTKLAMAYRMTHDDGPPCSSQVLAPLLRQAGLSVDRLRIVYSETLPEDVSEGLDELVDYCFPSSAGLQKLVDDAAKGSDCGYCVVADWAGANFHRAARLVARSMSQAVT